MKKVSMDKACRTHENDACLQEFVAEIGKKEITRKTEMP
jgi:hypothetical protein